MLADCQCFAQTPAISFMLQVKAWGYVVAQDLLRAPQSIMRCTACSLGGWLRSAQGALSVGGPLAATWTGLPWPT